MIKSIFKNDIKTIQYAKITQDNCIKPCALDVMVYKYKNTIIDLCIINQDGINIIKENIGKVINVNKYGIIIQFNETFGFDNKLYAILLPEKDHKTLSVIYKET